MVKWSKKCKVRAMPNETIITDVPTKLLKLMVELCPKKAGESITFSAMGKSVTRTSESRERGLAELERRKAAELLPRGRKA
jgi:hypothetical protein